ncbi:MAG TPA: hypothetical protein VI299_02795, partial [Polyangiales bacterium]
TLSGGAIAAIPNRRGPDALVVKAGILKSPTLDVEAKGTARIAFNGTQRAQSDLPASAWKFLHDVASGGGEVFNVFRSPLSGTEVLWSTLAGAGAQEVIAATGVITEQLAGYANVVSAAGAVKANALTYADSLLSPLQRAAFVSATVSGALYTGTANTADPSTPFTLGATATGSSPATMDWYETIIFPRALHEYERQLVREYLAARYGITAPALTGPDRDIMSLLPFAWLEAAANTSSGGKVAGFVDRARPGHSFSQPNPSNQVNVPATSSDFNGQLTVSTAGAGKFYDSNLPAAAWTFMHDGAGAEWVQLSKQTAAATCRIFGSAAIKSQSGVINQASEAGDAIFTVVNGTAVSFSGSLSNGSPLNAPVALSYSLTNRAWTIRNSNNVSATGVPGGLSSASPPATMRLLGIAAASSQEWQGDWASTLVFDRILSEPERNKRAAALTAKYGKGL